MASCLSNLLRLSLSAVAMSLLASPLGATCAPANLGHNIGPDPQSTEEDPPNRWRWPWPEWVAQTFCATWAKGWFFVDYSSPGEPTRGFCCPDAANGCIESTYDSNGNLLTMVGVCETPQ